MNNDTYRADCVDTGEQIEFVGKNILIAAINFINSDAAAHFPCAIIATNGRTYIVGHSGGKLTGLCKQRGSARTIAINYDEDYFNRLKGEQK